MNLRMENTNECRQPLKHVKDDGTDSSPELPER
jgi:hypothetical protein